MQPTPLQGHKLISCKRLFMADLSHLNQCSVLRQANIDPKRTVGGYEIPSLLRQTGPRPGENHIKAVSPSQYED